MRQNTLNAVYLAVGDAISREQLAAALCLRNKHIQAACAGDAELFRLQKQGCPCRIIYNIEYAAELGKLRKINGGFAVVGVHAHGRGVCDYFGIGVLCNVLVVVLALSGDDNDLACTEIFKHRLRRDGSTARSENERLFALYLNAVVHNEVFKAESVGVIAVETSVGAADYRVHAAYLRCRRRQLRTVGHDRFFVRYRDIQPVKFAAFEEIFKLLGRFFKQLVFVIGQHGMYLRRIAVAELFA